MIIHIRKVANGYVITKEPDAALISPQPPTFVAEHETDAHRIVGELLGVTDALDLHQEPRSECDLIDTRDLTVDSARLFIDLSASPQDRSQALGNAFAWQYSPQGHSFWLSIHVALMDNEPHPQLDEAIEIVARSIEEYERENS